MLNALTIEEMIALKMELVYKSLGKNVHGLPIWKMMPFIVRDGILRYICATSETKRDAIKLLGMSSNEFYQLFNTYGLREYFDDNPKEKGDGTN